MTEMKRRHNLRRIDGYGYEGAPAKGKSGAGALTGDPMNHAERLAGEAQNLEKMHPTAKELEIFLAFRDPNNPETWRNKRNRSEGELDLVDKEARSMTGLRAAARLARKSRALLKEQKSRIEGIKGEIRHSRAAKPGYVSTFERSESERHHGKRTRTNRETIHMHPRPPPLPPRARDGQAERTCKL